MTNEAAQDAVNTASATTAVKQRRPFLGKTREVSKRVGKFIPSMIYLLIVYAIVEYSVPDMNAVFFSFLYVKITPLLLVLGAAIVIPMLDLLRIARPNANKSELVNRIIIVAMIYAGLWLAGTVLLLANGSINWMKIFTTGEFFILVLATIVEWRVAINIMSFTQMRTVDMSNSDITQHDHN